MDDKMLEKRMELLNKSYERMPGQTDVSEVIKAIEREKHPERKRRKLIHWPFAASFIGILLISSVLVLQITGDQGGSLQSGQQSGMTSEEISKTIKEVESHYKIRRSQAIGSLGLTEARFSQTEMGSAAEEYVTHILQTLKDEKMQLYNDANLAEMINGNVDDMLKTPQQMLNGLTGKQIDNEKAEEWVEKYTVTQKALIPVYEEEMERFRAEWEGESKDGRLEGREILLEQEKQYSDKLIQLVEGATANGILLKFSEPDGQIQAGMDASYVSFLLSSSELPEVYMDVLTLESLPASLNGGVITTNWARAGGDLLLYESVLDNLPPGSGFLEEFRLEYTALLRAYVKGSSTQSLFNEDGSIKEDMKESFEKLMEKYPASKTAARIEPYYNKLKENQFSKPGNWDDFNMEYEL
jgi:hypothetical protein